MSKYNYKAVQIYCNAPVEILYDRYTKRDSSGDRHPGHILHIDGLEEFKRRICGGNFKLNIEGCVTLEIDTTKFEDIDLEKIYDAVRSVS